MDPAAGTLTFLAESAKLAVDEFVSKYGEGGRENFIREHILKNFYAFELMMAPYAIGHLKMSFLLEELGYRLKEDERFKLYLTNTLEMEELAQTELPGMASLSEESHLAGEVKKEQPILVILGNPPYSVSSSNKSNFIEKEMKIYKEKVRMERNIQPLSDDYIKFIRFAQWKLEDVNKGVIGIITNNSFIDGLIHRGMRESLFNEFDKIYILNLHGNLRIKETCPDKSKDENVFDIQPGVCISLFVKTGKISIRNRVVYYSDLYGIRRQKYDFLYTKNINNTEWGKLSVKKPEYWFIKRNLKLERIYKKGWKITSIFLTFNSGVKTHHDKELVYFNKENRDFEQYYLYRPFDIRLIEYNLNKVVRHRYSIMKHFILKKNIGLCIGRQASVIGSKTFNIIFVCENIVDTNLFRRGGHILCPLYLYPDKEGLGVHTITNFNEKFQMYINKLYSHEPNPEQIVSYIYAILYSPQELRREMEEDERNAKS